VLGLIKRIFDTNEKTLRRLHPILEHTNSLEDEMTREADLASRMARVRREVDGGKDLDEVMPEVFALVRESSRRYIGKRHHDVQIIGGAVLHRGNMAEMKTGEGKTLVAVLSLALNALSRRGGHLVTVNDYLAKWQAEWMGPVYRGVGLSVTAITHDSTPDERRAAYLTDVTYVTNSELGFDYLRDNMALSPEGLVLRADHPLHYAVIDEVDSILIDEARTPLIISGPAEKATDVYYTMAKVAKRLHRGEAAKSKEESPTGDYVVDEKSKTAQLTERGIKKLEEILGVDSLFDRSNMELAHMATAAVRAKECYHRDQEYIVQDGQVIIVDEFTGRLMPGRRYGEGLHQAIEAKENVKIERENQTLATITYQNFFRLYDKIAGMTGTAKTEEREFGDIYGTDVIVVPTDKPVIRKDHSDLIYRTEAGKFDNVVEDIVERHGRGQPILVGTRSIERSEFLGKLLKKRGVPHRILNAKYHRQEAEIIAQAGRSGTVTIATNMAGRGTDIVLGGNPEFLAGALLEKRGLDRYSEEGERFIRSVLTGDLETAKGLTGERPELDASLISEIQALARECAEDHKRVVEIGGLHIIGTERHESRRIDNQLRGRSGRQGDPGSSEFFVSFEDELMRLFLPERVLGMLDRLGMDDSQPLQDRLTTRSIETAQHRVEERNFAIRKQLLEFDNIMSEQRKLIYEQRREILLGGDVSEVIRGMVEDFVASEAEFHLGEQADPDEWNVGALRSSLVEAIPAATDFDFDALRNEVRGDAIEKAVGLAMDALDARERELGGQTMRALERFVLLNVIDGAWKEHLHNLDTLRQGINLRAYGQQDPIQAYKFEAFNLFNEMNDHIRAQVARLLFRLRVEVAPPLESQAQAAPVRVAASAAGGRGRGPAVAIGGGERGKGGKVGRNDPCPCGSGKKYKHCHGA
jgi:preprotein translocase subunit SecA